MREFARTYRGRLVAGIIRVLDGLELNDVITIILGEASNFVLELLVSQVGLVETCGVLGASVQPHGMGPGHKGLDAALQEKSSNLSAENRLAAGIPYRQNPLVQDFGCWFFFG